MRQLQIVLSVLLAALILGCIVQPLPTASNEVITSYNTQLITFWTVIATALISLISSVITIIMNKKSINASNHQNEKLNEQNSRLMMMNDTQTKLTEKLIKTDEKSNATDRQVAANAAWSGNADVPPQPPQPQVIIVKVPAEVAPAVLGAIAPTIPIKVEIERGPGVDVPLKVAPEEKK
jgi:hypothetical protein